MNRRTSPGHILLVVMLSMCFAAPVAEADEGKATFSAGAATVWGVFPVNGNIVLVNYEWPVGVAVNIARLSYEESEPDLEEHGSGYGITVAGRLYFSRKHEWIYTEQGVSYWHIKGTRVEQEYTFTGWQPRQTTPTYSGVNLWLGLGIKIPIGEHIMIDPHVNMSLGMSMIAFVNGINIGWRF